MFKYNNLFALLFFMTNVLIKYFITSMLKLLAELPYNHEDSKSCKNILVTITYMFTYFII